MADKRWVDPLEQYVGSNAALTAEQIHQCKKVYHVIGGNDISALLRSMGLTPSFLELRPLMTDPGAKAVWPFQDFVDTYAAYLKDRDTVDALTAQLKSFDHEGDGTLDSDELTSALTTIGDTLTDAQVKQLIASVGTTNRGKISIAVLAQHLIAD